MDHISHIMQYLDADEVHGISPLIADENDIIAKIRDIDPTFDIKGYLLNALQDLQRRSYVSKTPAYDLYIFMRDILKATHCAVSLVGENTSFYKDHVGYLCIYGASNVKIESEDVILSRYPDAKHIDISDGIISEEIGYRQCIEFIMPVANTKRFVSDFNMIKK